MDQIIIVLIIVGSVIAYSVYAVIKNIRKKETSPCDGCGGCDIKSEITKNISRTHSKDPASCGCGPK